MFEVIIVTVVLVAGALMVVQTFVIRSCFQVGQPPQSSHFSSKTLTSF